MTRSTSRVRQDIPTPDGAIELLMAGNQRFVDGSAVDHDHKATREELSGVQRPIAIVLRCADSRTSPEIVFDQGIGDLFVCAVAGNVPTSELVASMEYAVSMLGTPLIVVMGHSGCGAVTAAIKTIAESASLPGALPDLISLITPAATQVEDIHGEMAVPEAIAINVANGVERITEMSPIIRQAVESGQVRIIGGVHDLASGRFERV